jgi:hypothetical protein
MPALKAQLGFYPDPLDLTVGPIRVTTLPDLDEIVASVVGDPNVEGDWIYPGLARQHVMGVGERELPYSGRIFGLPMTHEIGHAGADDPEHLEFLVWALSFFAGMRLTTTEAGFVDAATIKPRKLIDFVLSPRQYAGGLELAEAFWQANRAYPIRAKRWTAAVHALFIAHWPQALQFERFIYLYGALDACFALAKEFHAPPPRLSHSARIGWMCGLFNMAVPAWATSAPGSLAEVAKIRNATLHESLFMDAPLGFALHGVGANQNLPLEMEAVVCRLLVALIGAPGADYVRSAVTTRQMQGLDF